MARKENKNAGREEQDNKIETDEEIISFDSKTIVPEVIEAKKADAADIEFVKQAEEIERLKNFQLRLQADFENYKKRNIEQSRKSYVDGAVDIITSFLPLLDTFDRAMAMITPEDTSGILAIKKQLDNILKSLNIQEIQALGLDFDPKYHNAVMQVEDEENADKVVDVLQKGYIYRDKIIRHSMVKVAK